MTVANSYTEIGLQEQMFLNVHGAFTGSPSIRIR